MRKTLAMILCAVLLCTLLSGCSLLSLLTLIMSSSPSDMDISVWPAETAIETTAPATATATMPTEVTPATVPAEVAPTTEPAEGAPTATESASDREAQVTEPVVLVQEYAKPYIPYTYEGGLVGQSAFDHLIRIPALSSDSADAQRINQEIYLNCQEAIETLEANAEEEVIYRIDYICKAHNGIVGLMMDYTVGYQSSEMCPAYTFYFFDTNRGVALTFDEYLQALGMTQNGVLDALRASGAVAPEYLGGAPEYLIVDETGTVLKVLAEESLHGFVLLETDYSVLEYPFY